MQSGMKVKDLNIVYNMGPSIRTVTALHLKYGGRFRRDLMLF